jgi:hypothetical protein
MYIAIFCLISLFGCYIVVVVFSAATFRMFIYRYEHCRNVTVYVSCRVIKYSVNNNKITSCSDRVCLVTYCLFNYNKLKSCIRVPL